MITRAQVLQDPTASHWLKDCLRTSEKRDKTDLLNDLEILNQIVTEEALDHAQYLQHRINEIKESELVDFDLIRCESL